MHSALFVALPSVFSGIIGNNIGLPHSILVYQNVRFVLLAQAEQKFAVLQGVIAIPTYCFYDV